MEDEISSTTGEVKLLQDPEENQLDFVDPQNFTPDADTTKTFDLDDDDILDLAGGARDALARHRATGHPEPDTERLSPAGLEDRTKPEDPVKKGGPEVEPVQTASRCKAPSARKSSEPRYNGLITGHWHGCYKGCARVYY
ncbi:hypothetical protein MHYP_G00359750 [Metynnis hypsauchen]